jgi:dTDP-4-amino-4,6-dideoxygalactose transaminase
MPESIESCEQALAMLLGRKHCILTGRGATGLWIAYSLSDQKRPKVLLPAMVCNSPMFTVLYANRIPVFSDVLTEDATIDPQRVKAMLEADPEIGAVLAVHLYGHPAAMAELVEICAEHEVLLIEDVAQALGGVDGEGNLFGALGDLTILSFGHTKIINVGGGGALLTDSDEMASQIRTLNNQLPEKKSDNPHLGGLYGKLYYPIWESGQVDASFYKLFDSFPELFHDLYFSQATSEIASSIENALALLNNEVKHRRLIAEIYTTELQSLEDVSLFNPSGPGVPWRFTFRVKASKRLQVLEAILGKGLDASKWYPSIAKWTPSGREQGDVFPAADLLQQEVVNLWLSQDYSPNKAKEVAQVIKGSL